MSTLTVRITRRSHKTLRSMARSSGASMQDLLDEAVEELRRKQFFEHTNSAYHRLRSDPAAWKREKQDRKEWDATIADGLDD